MSESFKVLFHSKIELYKLEFVRELTDEKIQFRNLYNYYDRNDYILCCFFSHSLFYPANSNGIYDSVYLA